MSDWFSKNPDKAWAERYFLAASLLWIAAVALVVLSGWLRTWGDLGYLLFSVVAAAPMTLGAFLCRPASDAPLCARYFVKLNVFAAILVFFGTYFGTHYFFDLMGMRYAFPTELVFEAAVVGKSGAHVPIFMYPLTQAYFVTYFSVLVVLDRGLSNKLRLGAFGRVVLVGVLSYAIAFAETLFMATERMKDLFSYAKHDRMLLFGSIGYAAYFVVGLPVARRIDEHEPGSFPLQRVVVHALAASMAILILLELWAKLIGPL